MISPRAARQEEEEEQEERERSQLPGSAAARHATGVLLSAPPPPCPLASPSLPFIPSPTRQNEQLGRGEAAAAHHQLEGAR